MQERIPPHSTEAEKAVLGAVMLNSEALFDVMDVVKPEDFYNKSHQEIFDCIRDMYSSGKAIDIVTVTEEMKNRGTLTAVGGSAYISELTSDIPSTSNAAEYAKIVAEKAAIRRLIQASNEILEDCYAGNEASDDIMDNAEKRIFKIAENGQKKDYIPVKEIIYDNVELISERCKQDGRLSGLTSGFRDLDDKLGGFQNGNLIIVAARPGMGKTAFALNVALNAAEKGGANVLFFDLEMPAQELGERLLAMKSNVDMERIKKGTVQQDEWKEIILASEEIGKCNINIDNSTGPNMHQIRNKCRRMKAKQGLDLIVVDYLQLMIESKDNVVNEIGQLSRAFKLLAIEMNCPVILLSQLSRDNEKRKGSHKPMLSDLRGSGSIEQDADIVLFLYRENYYDEESSKPGLCEIEIAKHRNGAPGTINLTWVARYTKFADCIV